MKPNKWQVLPLFLLLILISCQKEELVQDFESSTAYILPYAKMFYTDLEKRGIHPQYTLEELDFVFFDDQGDGNTGIANKELIAFNKQAWFVLPEYYKKFTVYHELGHSVLGRNHDNELLPNGEFKSIMRGNPMPLFKYFDCCFKGFRESYYLDELFDSNIQKPVWANQTFNFTQIADTIFYTENLNSLNKELLTKNKFQIELKVPSKIDKAEKIGFIWDKSIPIKRGIYLENSAVKVVGLEILGKDFFDYTSEAANLNDNSNSLQVQKVNNYVYYFLNKKFLFFEEYPENPQPVMEVINSMNRAGVGVSVLIF